MAAPALAAGLVLAACGGPGSPPAPPAPPGPDVTARPAAGTAAGASAVHALGQRAEAPRGMVASAHPLASDAGIEMLRRGGNAVDAAVATAFAVGVVEPMMSGIGGGGSMLVWRQENAHPEYLDFYAAAPAGIDPAKADVRGDPARLVAVPGAVKGLLEAHARHGRLSREDVLGPALRIAEEGFPVSPLLARTIADDSAKLTRPGRAQELFWPDMRPLGAGETLVQPELAATLRRISERGAAGFHEGPVAEEIVRVLRGGGNPIEEADLAAYEPKWRRPVCGTYRGRVVLSAPPPQSGLQVVETLHLLDDHDLAGYGWPTASGDAFHALVDALRIGIADRQTFMGDPDSSAVPALGLTSRAYARARGRDRPDEAPRRVEPGDPWAQDSLPPSDACAPFEPVGAARSATPGRLPAAVGWGGPGPGAVEAVEAVEAGETTHLSVVDAEGNAVSLTITQGAYFGSGMWAAGTFLNNAMSIFSSDAEGPNALRPGARPTSTTTPTVILEDGRVRMVVGSPGGGRIPPAVVQAVVYVLDYDMDPLEALRMPRVQPQFSTRTVELEQGFSGDVLAAARARGYEPRVLPPLSLYFGGVHLIEWRDGRWVGAADPRRDGQVRGH